MEFEEIDLDKEFPDSLSNLFLNEGNIGWFLWSIGAETRQEQTDFQKIFRVIQKKNSLSITHQELNTLGIKARSNPLITKLLRYGYCLLSSNDIVLKKFNLDVGNFEAFLKSIRDRFKVMDREGDHRYQLFPTAQFLNSRIDKIRSIEVEMVDHISSDIIIQECDLLEIRFTTKPLPNILLPIEFFDDLEKICLQKMIYHLAKFAGEKADFFSEKIENNRVTRASVDHRFVQDELGRINKKTDREAREEYTKILLRDLFQNREKTFYFITDLASESNNYILTRYDYHNPLHFDFLQALEILKHKFLHHGSPSDIGVSTLVKVIHEDLKLYVTEDELKWNVLREDPRITDQHWEELYQRFLREFVSDPGDRPRILRFFIRNEEGKAEKIFIHILNLNRFLDLQLRHAKPELDRKLRSHWFEELAEHRYLRSMFDNDSFNESILQIVKEKHPLLEGMIHENSLYQTIDKIEHPSVFVDKLKRFKDRNIYRVFDFRNTDLLNEAYGEILDTKGLFGRFFFRIFHWLTMKIYLKRLEEPLEEKTRVNGKGIESNLFVAESENAALAAAGVNSEEALTSEVDRLWNKIPKTQLQRNHIDQNVAGDLNSFFQGKQEIHVRALNIIVETNLNRILNQAPYLNGYSKQIAKYIRYQMFLTIYRDSFMRSKLRF